jgi:hypothetical protein
MATGESISLCPVSGCVERASTRMRVKLVGSIPIKDSCGPLKERRCMIADAHGMPMSGVSAHLIELMDNGERVSPLGP